MPWGNRSMLFRDPDGNPINLFKPLAVNSREALLVRNSDLAQSRFSDAKLSLSSFDDVNMQGSTFTNINLGNASFIDVDLSNVSIKNANLTGMKINDVLVSELIRVYEKHSK